jgi:SAM-dependent methyltransferase
MAKPTKIKIHPESSAQRRSQPANPALKLALAFVRHSRPEIKKWGRVADLGCGKLRHYDLLLPGSDELYLVDTQEQLSRLHADADQKYRITDVAATARENGKRVFALSSGDFADSSLNLDLIVCVAVLDVVAVRTRVETIRAAARNLRRAGLLIIVAPRNDSTILRRCSSENLYQDGHVFFHHGIYTFYRNFRDHSSIISTANKEGLVLTKDLSCYRQVCLIFSVGEINARAQKSV